MAKIYTDSLDRIVLDDEQGDTLIFDVIDDKVAIYQDSKNEIDRKALEDIQVGLEVDLSDMITILEFAKYEISKFVDYE